MRYITIISWDCAYKTLAWARITIDTEINIHRERLRVKLAASDPEAWEETALELLRLLEGWFIIERVGVVDVLKGRAVEEVSTVDRARCLNEFLVSNAAEFVADMTLVEAQPSMIGPKANTVSAYVAQQIIYHFLHQAPTVISSGKKNKVTMVPELEFKVFSKGKNTHATRKAHAVASFKHLYCWLGPTARLQLDAIPADQKNHIADAVMQTVALVGDAKGPLVRPTARNKK
jgi:hypothetical protein